MDNVATFCMLLMLFIFIFRCVRRRGGLLPPGAAARGRPVAKEPLWRSTGGPAPGRDRPPRQHPAPPAAPSLASGPGVPWPEPEEEDRFSYWFAAMRQHAVGDLELCSRAKGKGAEGRAGRQASWGSWTLVLSLGPGRGPAWPRPPEQAGAESGPHRLGETDTRSGLSEARVASSVPSVLGFGLTTYRMETACPWTWAALPRRKLEFGEVWRSGWWTWGDQAEEAGPCLALTSHSLCPCLSTPPLSILGMHLFGCKFSLKTDTGDTIPDRKNFDSLLWAIVTVFQVQLGRPSPAVHG